MEQVCYLGGATAAGILSAVSLDDMMVWAWLLIAAEASALMLLRQRAESRTKSAPAFARVRRPIRYDGMRLPRR